MRNTWLKVQNYEVCFTDNYDFMDTNLLEDSEGCGGKLEQSFVLLNKALDSKLCKKTKSNNLD